MKTLTTLESIQIVHTKLVRAQQRVYTSIGYKELMSIASDNMALKAKLTELHKKAGITTSFVVIDGVKHIVEYRFQKRRYLNRDLLTEEEIQKATIQIEAWMTDQRQEVDDDPHYSEDEFEEED